VRRQDDSSPLFDIPTDIDHLEAARRKHLRDPLDDFSVTSVSMRGDAKIRLDQQASLYRDHRYSTRTCFATYVGNKAENEEFCL